MARLEDYLSKRKKTIEPTATQGPTSSFVIQQHTTFINKKNVGFIVCYPHKSKEDSFAFIFDNKLYTHKGIKPITEELNQSNALLIPVTKGVEFDTMHDRADSSLHLIQKIIPPLRAVNGIDKLLLFYYGESNLRLPTIIEEKSRRKLTASRKGAALILFRGTDNLRTHYDFRLPYEGVLKSWAVPKTLPSWSRRNALAIETEDHPLSYGTFSGTIPFGYGMGQVEIYDTGNITITRAEETVYAFELFGKHIKGNYILKKQKDSDANWFFSFAAPKKKEEVEKPTQVSKELAPPAFIQDEYKTPSRPDVSLQYKYTPTMSPVRRTYQQFNDSVFKKNFNLLYSGSYELLLSTEFIQGNKTFYQIDLDFDSLTAVSAIKQLAGMLRQHDLDNLFIVQCSGGGYHVRSLFAISGISYQQLKDSEFFKQFSYLDIVSSFRVTPSRVPYAYSQKRKFTNFAVTVPQFLTLDVKETIQYFSATPNKIMQPAEFRGLLDYFYLPHAFITKEDDIARRFLKLIK